MVREWGAVSAGALGDESPDLVAGAAEVGHDVDVPHGSAAVGLGDPPPDSAAAGAAFAGVSLDEPEAGALAGLLQAGAGAGAGHRITSMAVPVSAMTVV